jgi:hypothetical protein
MRHAVPARTPSVAPVIPWRPALALLGAAFGLAVSLPPPLQAQSQPPPPPPDPAPPQLAAAPDPAIQTLVETAAAACRASLARRFSTSTEQVETWLVPGLAIAIESGETGLGTLRREGLQFGWMVHGKPNPLPIGVCRTDGAGGVNAIEEQKD